MLFTGCNSKESDAPLESAATTALPLQQEALVIGGDVQSRATDVFTVQLTPQQAEDLGEVCPKTLELGNGDSCEEFITRLLRMQAGSSEPDDACAGIVCLHLMKFAASDTPALGDGGYLEVIDNRAGETLCDSNPAHLCLRVGIQSAAALGQLTTSSATSPTPGPTTSTETPTPTPTETPDSTQTPSEPETTPNETTSDSDTSTPS
jgi:hypothetical protein